MDSETIHTYGATQHRHETYSKDKETARKN